MVKRYEKKMVAGQTHLKGGLTKYEVDKHTSKYGQSQEREDWTFIYY
jgi:hypothetical protein